MSSPYRFQRKRASGWTAPPNSVMVTRPGRFGNPFNLKGADHCWTAIHYGFKGDKRGRAQAAVAMYIDWVKKGEAVEIDCGLICQDKDGKTHRLGSSPVIKTLKPPTMEEIINELRGKNLGCWCGEEDPCHGGWLLEVANS